MAVWEKWFVFPHRSGRGGENTTEAHPTQGFFTRPGGFFNNCLPAIRQDSSGGGFPGAGVGSIGPGSFDFQADEPADRAGDRCGVAHGDGFGVAVIDDADHHGGGRA